MVRVIAVALLVAGCGRVRFDALADGSGIPDVVSDGTAPIAPSCMGLASTCGPVATGSCCESPLVPGGMFYRSYDVGADLAFPDMTYPANVSTFRIDKYELTVGRFRQFVAAGQSTQASSPQAGVGAHAKIANSGWDASWNASLVANTAALRAAVKCDANFQTWTDSAGPNESRPINCITWFEAFALCAWDGGYLPTEAEWNYAAAGGNEQRAYPWSNPPGDLGIDNTYASYFVDPTKQCFGDGVNGCAVTDLIDVGTKPAGDGRWGQSDLAGNVMEWTLDWYVTPYPQNPCSDCANLVTDFGRAYRNGSFHTNLPAMRGGYRGTFLPSTRFPYVGVRCARAP